jgi:hypothetical protein
MRSASALPPGYAHGGGGAGPARPGVRGPVGPQPPIPAPRERICWLSLRRPFQNSSHGPLWPSVAHPRPSTAAKANRPRRLMSPPAGTGVDVPGRPRAVPSRECDRGPLRVGQRGHRAGRRRLPGPRQRPQGHPSRTPGGHGSILAWASVPQLATTPVEPVNRASSAGAKEGASGGYVRSGSARPLPGVRLSLGQLESNPVDPVNPVFGAERKKGRAGVPSSQGLPAVPRGSGSVLPT